MRHREILRFRMVVGRNRLFNASMEFRRDVLCSCSNMKQWQSRSLESLIHALIPILTFGSIMTGVVQFDSQHGSHRLRMTQEKVEMLLTRAVPYLIFTHFQVLE